MARIRTVKPEMAQDEDLASVSIEAQLLAVRILNHADDEGYFKANPALVKANCFPLIDSLNAQTLLTELAKIGYIRIGVGSDGKKYGQVVNFSQHQKINRPTDSKIKGLVMFSESSVSDQGVLPIGKERKGKEGKRNGAAATPPNFWDVGKGMGIPGSLIGKWIKDTNEGQVAEAIAKTAVKNPADPKQYCTALLQDRPAKLFVPEDDDEMVKWSAVHFPDLKIGRTESYKALRDRLWKLTKERNAA